MTIYHEVLPVALKASVLFVCPQRPILIHCCHHTHTYEHSSHDSPSDSMYIGQSHVFSSYMFHSQAPRRSWLLDILHACSWNTCLATACIIPLAASHRLGARELQIVAGVQANFQSELPKIAIETCVLFERLRVRISEGRRNVPLPPTSMFFPINRALFVS